MAASVNQSKRRPTATRNLADMFIPFSLRARGIISALRMSPSNFYRGPRSNPVVARLSDLRPIVSPQSGTIADFLGAAEGMITLKFQRAASDALANASYSGWHAEGLATQSEVARALRLQQVRRFCSREKVRQKPGLNHPPEFEPLRRRNCPAIPRSVFQVWQCRACWHFSRFRATCMPYFCRTLSPRPANRYLKH
jgi:hypothetical protein